jgi:hypothetical protein
MGEEDGREDKFGSSWIKMAFCLPSFLVLQCAARHRALGSRGPGVCEYGSDDQLLMIFATSCPSRREVPPNWCKGWFMAYYIKSSSRKGGGYQRLGGGMLGYRLIKRDLVWVRCRKSRRLA